MVVFREILWILLNVQERIDFIQMKCLRCGKDFDDPRPEVTQPGLNPEIACVSYCPDCNRAVMSYVFRNNSAYFRKDFQDPMKEGNRGV